MTRDAVTRDTVTQAPEAQPLKRVVVAGHVCLDLIPSFDAMGEGARLEPGSLLEVGAATLAPGGGVANVGGALLKLGVPAALIGKVGDDAFGGLLEGLLRAPGLIRAPGESTSYSVVLSLPGSDRIFLHHPGCNDTFGPDDVDLRTLAGADLLYFGYPPLMRRLYEDGGRAFAAFLERVKGLGLTTVLDLAMPDPQGPSGRADWPAFLARVLPFVDVFMPSLTEVAWMLGERPTPEDPASLERFAQGLLERGTRAVGLKLGEHGLYLRTADAPLDLGRAFPDDLTPWSGRELLSPVFEATVRGTTGAGDATVAGFLAGLVRGAGPERLLELACAVGAASVEAADAVSGVPTWAGLGERLARGWRRAAPHPNSAYGNPAYWRAGPNGVWLGQHDLG